MCSSYVCVIARFGSHLHPLKLIPSGINGDSKTGDYLLFRQHNKSFDVTDHYLIAAFLYFWLMGL